MSTGSSGWFSIYLASLVLSLAFGLTGCMAGFLHLVNISSDFTLGVFGDNMGMGEKFIQ